MFFTLHVCTPQYITLDWDVTYNARQLADRIVPGLKNCQLFLHTEYLAMGELIFAFSDEAFFSFINWRSFCCFALAIVLFIKNQNNMGTI